MTWLRNVFAPRATGRRRLVPILLTVVLVLGVIGGGWWLFERVTTNQYTAYFDRSVAIYPGSEVRVLGVEVGTVKSVEPQGDKVKVVLNVDWNVDVPASARAVQINPSVVGDRYVQLTPAYTSGPKMSDGATIPRDRTATPVEVDRLYKSIKELADALGPNGANKDGAVTDLVTTSAANLAGNGEALKTSITNLTRAARYFSDARGDLFGTVKNLQAFISQLAINDQQVRTFNTQLAGLSGFLASERQDLGNALTLLSSALGDIARFVDNNRTMVETNAGKLTTLTKTLADQRDALAKALPEIPLALSNLINAHNAESGTLDMRANIPDLQNPFDLTCRLLDIGSLKPGDPAFETLGKQMRPVVDSCRAINDQLLAGVKAPQLILPLGMLSGDVIQRGAVPGTVPGVQSDRKPPSQTTPGAGR